LPPVAKVVAHKRDWNLSFEGRITLLLMKALNGSRAYDTSTMEGELVLQGISGTIVVAYKKYLHELK